MFSIAGRRQGLCVFQATRVGSCSKDVWTVVLDVFVTLWARVSVESSHSACLLWIQRTDALLDLTAVDQYNKLPRFVQQATSCH